MSREWIFGGVLIEATGTLDWVSPAGLIEETGAGSYSISLTGIASAQALGTPTFSIAYQVLPTGIVTAQSLGSPSFSVAYQILPTAITSGQSLGSPSFSVAYNILPTAIASGQSIGTPSFSVAYSILPGSISSGQSVGNITILFADSIIPSSIVSAEAFGTASFTHGSEFTCYPVGIGSGEVFGTPTLVAPSSAKSALIFEINRTSRPHEHFHATGFVADSILSGERFGSPTFKVGYAVKPVFVPEPWEPEPWPDTLHIRINVEGVSSQDIVPSPAFSFSYEISPYTIGTNEELGKLAISRSRTERERLIRNNLLIMAMAS